jgi:hypothetical protein
MLVLPRAEDARERGSMTRRMVATDDGFIARVSFFLGRFRALFVPLGLFSILAIGIHSGSDHIDDLAYAWLNVVDAVLDDILAAVIRPVWSFFGASDGLTQAAIFRAVDLIDLGVKDQFARFVALIVEFLADVMLAFPLFFYREREVDLHGILKKTMKDPTVLRVAAPICAALASVAGVLIITREIQVFAHSGLLAIRSAGGFAGWVASLAGLAALVLVTWRLGWVVTVAAIRWAESRAVEDQRNQVPKRKRRIAGWFTAVIALPISVFAFIDAVAVIGRIQALIPG